MAFEPTGSTLYIAERFAIFTLNMATLNMALLAGNRDSSGFVSGSSTAARFNYLQAVHWHAPEGVLLTAESSAFALRAVYPNGTVRHLAGGSAGYSNGPATSARFGGLFSVTSDGVNTAYVADQGISTNAAYIRRYYFDTRTVDTLVSASYPEAVAFEPLSGMLYYAWSAGRTISRLPANGTGTSEVVAGFGHCATGLTVCDGPFNLNYFNQVKALEPTAAGHIFAGDQALRYIDTAARRVVTQVGVMNLAGLADGYAGQARLGSARDVAVSPVDGTVFLLDASNSLIRRVQAAPAATATCAPNPAAAAGYVTSTFAGSGLAGAANGDFTTATFRQPKGVTVNPEGGLFMADNAGGTIRSISYSGSVTTIAGSLTGPAAPVDGILGVNRVYLAEFMAYDPTLQRLLFTDYTLIRYVSLGFENRSVTTLCGFWLSSGSNDGIGGRLTDGGQMVAVRTGPSTMVYYVMNTNTIRAITQSGVISTFVGSATEAGLVDGVGTAARLNTNGKQASLVHWPGANALIVADTFTIRRVSLDPATLGTVTRIGGSPTLNANYVSNTLANAAIFTLVTAMSLVSNRTLFLYDAGSYSFRALDLETSMVTTLSCPNPGGFSGYVDGELTDTRFGSIDGMAFDSDLGALFVSDGGNRRVRRIEGPF